MKKILSMVLCILMVASVFAIPVSVSASTADEAVFDPTTTMYYTVDYVRADGSMSCWDDAYVYEWTPATDGTLILENDDSCDDAWVVVGSNIDMSASAALEPGMTSASVEVTAGVPYTISVMTWSEESGAVAFWAFFEEGSSDSALEGAGTYENPYVIDSTVTELPAIAMGETNYYAISADPITTYNLSVRGGFMMDSFDLYVINNDTTVSSMMGQAAVENIAPYTATQKIVFSITNTALGEGGPYTFELIANEASTLGTAEDPDTLVLDAITTADIAGATYYYAYTAEQDGTLAIQFMITDDWVCSISGGAADAVYVESYAEDAVNPVTYPVTAGEEIIVWVAVNDFTAGSVYFKATFEAAPVLPEHTYNVAGEAELCGEGWNPAANQMTYDGDGTWSITFENVPAGDHEFKVVQDGAWNNPDFNLEGSANGAGNAVVTVEVDGSTVIIGFDGEKAIIEDIIAPELPPVDEPATKDEPVVDDATKDEPVVDDATKDEPVVDDATKDEPVVDDATKDEATKDEATKDEASKDEASKDEASKDEASKDEATKDEYAVGDVNRDGELNIKDVTAIQKYLAKLEEFDEAQVAIADYNEDGRVSIQDATRIQKKLAKLI